MQASSTWAIYQLIVIALCALVAFFLFKAIKQRVNAYVASHPEHWMRHWTKELLAALGPACFLLLVWLSLCVFRQITWPSNTFILKAVTNLTFAWVVITIFSSFIRNKLLSNIIAVTLWLIAALSILGVLPGLMHWFDARAVTVGETKVSILSAVYALLIGMILIWGVGLLSKVVDRALKASSDISPSMQVLFSKFFRIALTVFAIVTAMNMVGIDLTAFAVFSGAIGVGIGFGLQKTVSNFFSGITLLLDKSIKPGDVVTVGDTFGWISRINTRFTSIVVRDGREHIIPNEDLISKEVINWSYTSPNVRLDVEFGVSYKADPHKVKAIIESASQRNARVLSSPAPVCHFKEMGESSLNFVFRFWIADPQAGLQNVKSDVLFMIWDALLENNIEVPFPQRDLRFPDAVKVEMVPSKPD